MPAARRFIGCNAVLPVFFKDHFFIQKLYGIAQRIADGAAKDAAANRVKAAFSRLLFRFRQCSRFVAVSHRFRGIFRLFRVSHRYSIPL